MSLPTKIVDGIGRGHECGVTAQNALRVAVVTTSAADQTLEELTQRRLYRGFLRDAGGSNDLTIDGSTTSVEFYLAAESGVTRWITSVRVLLNDTGMEINTADFRDFGSGHTSGLTNGLQFWVEQAGAQTDLFIDPIKTIGGFMDFADSYVNFVNAIGSQEDFLSFDFNFEVPIVLPPDSQDRIVIKVRDNLVSVDLFTVIARGYQESVT